MVRTTLFILIVTTTSCLASPAGMGPIETPAMRFQKGSSMIARGKYKMADTYFTALTKVAPDRPRYWWGLGLVKKARGLHEEALLCWKKTLQLDGAMWRCYEQKVQSCQHLGLEKERDKAIEKLNELKKKAQKGTAISKKEFFCRERFSVGKELVLGLQYYDGDERKFRFSVGNQAKGEQRFAELRQFTYPNHKDFILYAFCEVTKGPDTCLALFANLPTYEQLREIFVSRLQNKERPPSTKAERDLFLRVVPLVTKEPFEPWAMVCRSWGVRFISEIPDILVSLDFSLIAPIISKKYEHEVLLVGQYTLCAGIPAIERPKEKVPTEETTISAMNGMLDVYEALVKRDKKARQSFLDEALKSKKEGKLLQWLKKRPKRYEAEPRPKTKAN